MLNKQRVITVKYLFFVALISLLSACVGTEERIDPPVALIDFQASLKLEKRWSQRIDGVEDIYLKLPPYLDEKNLYLVDNNHTLRVFDRESGKPLWKRRFEKNFSSGLSSGAGRLYVGTSQGEVLALNITNGELLWQSQLSAEILSTPQFDAQQLAVQSNDGKLYLLTAESGQRLWSFDTKVPALSLRGTSSPLILDDRIIAGFAAGKLAALNRLDGRVLWETMVAQPSGRSELARMVDIDGAIQYQAGVVFASTYQGRIAAVDAERGRIIWAREMSSYAGVSIDSSQLYVSDSDSHVWALDLQTGATIWQQNSLHARQVGEPLLTSQGVVVGDFAGYLHWLSTEDGHFLARSRVTDFELIRDEILKFGIEDHDHFKRTYDGIITPLVISGEQLYAINNDGVVVAYQINAD